MPGGGGAHTVSNHAGAFAEALERFKEDSGLTWKELARRLGTSTLNLWRWRNGVRPNMEHLLALQKLAADLGLAHLLPGGEPASPRA